MVNFSGIVPTESASEMVINHAWFRLLSEGAAIKAETRAEEVRDFFAGKGKVPKKRDYPAVLAACAARGVTDKIYFDESGYIPDFEGELLVRLEALGKIGGKNEHIYCKNPIGNCAEPHAALQLLSEQSAELKDIYFGQPYRPRTMERIAPCINCQSVFDTIKANIGKYKDDTENDKQRNANA